jgi:ferrochelatase
MATSSDYVKQLEETAMLVAEAVGVRDWKLVYQSRSGPPSQPWLEPDIADHIRAMHEAGRSDLVIAPIGFISDHMEVLYDLDTEAAQLCDELGLKMARAKTAGTHPAFVRMIRDLIGRGPTVCAPDCCAPPVRPGRP